MLNSCIDITQSRRCLLQRLMFSSRNKSNQAREQFPRALMVLQVRVMTLKMVMTIEALFIL